MRKFLSAVMMLIFISGYSQVAPDKYFIGFTDKNGTPYSIDQPQQFLTQRSIDRRNREYVAITEDDLPVNPQYIQAVAAKGVTVLTVSKWLNGVTIYSPDPALIDSIAKLPFVKNVVKNKQHPGENYLNPVDKFRIEDNSGEPVLPSALPKNPASGYRYGYSYNQIHMLHGDGLHQMGYHGEGMEIAILDGGFYNVDKFHAFDSLRANGQILGTKDFVNPGGDVYTQSSHGMSVLSVMGGNIPDSLVGTAPKAKFWLLRSEDVYSENIIEEYNWVCAAEFADSVGADVINSSLGYTVFNDTTMNHTCADMNGNTTVVTRGANMAAHRGIVVVNSAGNDGTSLTWHCVGAPADGTDVFGIAAVDSLGNYAPFSSKGRIDTTYVKPNVAAQGEETTIFSGSGKVSRNGNGTSFSSPVMAGLVACLRQAMPAIDHYHIMRAIERSASHYDHPDTLTGFGLPDFVKALNLLPVNEIKKEAVSAWPNPFTRVINLNINSGGAGEGEINIFDISGRKILHKTITLNTGKNSIRVDGLEFINPGFYILQVLSPGASTSVSMMKVN